MPSDDVYSEAERQFVICNACRYCEGFCAVFPAMEKRVTFSKSDTDYLANVCHDCRACYYACPFTPPHEFAINIPEVLSEVRLRTYKEFTRPKFLSVVFQKQRTVGLALILLSLLAVFGLVTLVGPPARLLEVDTSPGSFYHVLSYDAIVISGLVVGALVVLAWLLGISRFWRNIAGSSTPTFAALRLALIEAVGHKWFRGGGAGCTYPTEEGSYSRLLFHLLVFGGFAVDIASTIMAAVYQDVFGLLPPYPLESVPVSLGLAGGVAIIGGVIGLVYLKATSDKRQTFRQMLDLDYVFIALLGFTSLSGILTLIGRSGEYMGMVFSIHLALILSLFLLAPYGKFIHFVFRFVALVKRGVEEPTQ